MNEHFSEEDRKLLMASLTMTATMLSKLARALIALNPPQGVEEEVERGSSSHQPGKEELKR